MRLIIAVTAIAIPSLALAQTPNQAPAQKAAAPTTTMHFHDGNGVIRTANSVRAKRGVQLANLSTTRALDWAKAKIGKGCNPAYTTFVIKPVSGSDVPHIVPTHCKDRTLKQGRVVQCEGKPNTMAVVWIDEKEDEVVPVLCGHTAPTATKKS